MDMRQKEIIFFFTHAITILSLFTYSVYDEKVKIKIPHPNVVSGVSPKNIDKKVRRHLRESPNVGKLKRGGLRKVRVHRRLYRESMSIDRGSIGDRGFQLPGSLKISSLDA